MTMRIDGNPAPLFEALAKARAAFKPVHFDNEGQIQNRRYKYATLAAVLESVTPGLCANGLALFHTRGTDGENEVFTHVLSHVSGAYISSEQRVPAVRTDREGTRRLTEQEFGSAFTYGRRYAIQGLLGIAAEEDDDGAEASKPQERRDRQQAPSPRPEPKAAPAVSQKPASAPPPALKEWDVAKGQPAGEEEDSRPAQSDEALDKALQAAFASLRKDWAPPALNSWAKKVTGKVPGAWNVSDGRKFLQRFNDGERP